LGGVRSRGRQPAMVSARPQPLDESTRLLYRYRSKGDRERPLVPVEQAEGTLRVVIVEALGLPQCAHSGRLIGGLATFIHLDRDHRPPNAERCPVWRTIKINDRRTPPREATQIPGRSSPAGRSPAPRRRPAGHTDPPGAARPSSPDAGSGAPATPPGSAPVPTPRGGCQRT